jgi:hypothetical protein
MERVLFARVGWMLWYRGVQTDDPKPIGGGAYNETELGNERFNFLRFGNRYLGYFQPQMQPKERWHTNPSTIHLGRIEPGFVGDKMNSVLVVFVARRPDVGGQCIVGWYRNATVYRYEQNSTLKAREEVGYFLEAAAGNAVLLPERRRTFIVPSGKGGFGQANICYVFHGDGSQKDDAPWMADALEFVKSYSHENAATSPESATDQDIADTVEVSIERGAGYQSNPRIRMAIEDYAMKWAERHLRREGLQPVDKHKTESFDFLCSFSGKDLFVEVKGTQSDGTCISLTPNEVTHARKNQNSALFIVYDLQVKDGQPPKVAGGKELFLMPWDINAGKLEARGYAFTVPAHAFTKL